MSKSPSKYGGIAAVLVLGIGLFAMGKTWAGVGAVVFGGLAMLVTFAPSASGKFFFAGVGALLLSGILGYQAASNEVHGTATYHEGFGRSSRSERVTREGSPDKFREATNFLWAGSVVCVLLGAVVLHLTRRMGDSAADF